jgi:hypothetical protein
MELDGGAGRTTGSWPPRAAAAGEQDHADGRDRDQTTIATTAAAARITT